MGGADPILRARMGTIDFVRNFTDRSNTSGYQFEFHCDKCGNGHLSTFKTSGVGVASSLLKAAGSFFGGTLQQAAYAGDHVKDALRGGDWDSAYKEAVGTGKSYFKHCTRCGHWVCPVACWNEERQLCEECAPNLKEEVASIQAKVAVEQAWTKVRATDQHPALKLDEPQAASSTCPHCNAKVGGGKFCTECGKALAAVKVVCTGCGTELPPRAKFCADCGTARP